MLLGVNVDHVATLRQARYQDAGGQARGGNFPDPVKAAVLCQRVGAHSVVMHLREDRRHIHEKDLFRAKRDLTIKLNMEMSIAPDIVQIALKLKPGQVTFVPEKRKERTTEGGLDLAKKTKSIERCIEQMKARRILVSLFIDPDRRQVEMAKRLDADAVEFHTGDYANGISEAAQKKQWQRLKEAVILARAMRLAAHAGHGLDYKNVAALRKIKGIEELNIGYAIVTRALWVGMERAVREMVGMIQ